MNDEHLTESRRHLIDRSADERMVICGEDFWIPMPRYDKYFKIIHKMLSREGQHQAQCALFSSSYGGGKTAFLLQLMEIYRFRPQKLKTILMDQNLDKFRLLDLICEAFDVRSWGRGAAGSRSAMIMRAIRNGNYCAIVVDELHDALHESERTLMHNLSLLKHMCGGKFKLNILAFGDQKASDIIAADGQVGRRFAQYALPGWSCDDEFKEFVTSYVAHLPLHLPSPDVMSREFLVKLYKLSYGIMDNFVKFLKAASEVAIEMGEERISTAQLKDFSEIILSCGYALQVPESKGKKPRHGN
ncbi:Bacterial TniB protein [compost metagenome]